MTTGGLLVMAAESEQSSRQMSGCEQQSSGELREQASDREAEWQQCNSAPAAQHTVPTCCNCTTLHRKQAGAE